MNGWLIFGAIVLILFLLSLVRVGGEVHYSEAGLTVRVRVGPALIQVFPLRRKKPKRAQKERPKKPKKPKKPKQLKEKKPVDILGLLKRFLPLTVEAASGLRRRIRIDKLYADFIAGGANPAAAAIQFGTVNLMAGSLCPLLERGFDVKDRRIRTRVEFLCPAPTVSLTVGLSMTIGQGVSFAVRLFVQFLRIFLAYRTEQKEKNAAAKQKEAV